VTASIALFLALSQAPPDAVVVSPPSNVVQGIVSGLLDYEASTYPSQNPSERICVTPTLTAPLERERNDREERRRDAPSYSYDDHDWVLPLPRTNPDSPLLEAVRAHALDRMVTSAVAALPRHPHYVRRISQSAVPASFVLRRRRGCSYGALLSAPVIVGDIAFLNADYDSGGNLYALEHRHGRWVVIALANTWIS
jgi:hypothetical protein